MPIKNLAKFCLLVFIATSLLSGCDPHGKTEVFHFGPESIRIDGTSGTVRVYQIDSAGIESELYDTMAASDKGWSTKKTRADAIKLSTGDLGSFDLRREKSGWLVVPENTFLSPSRAYAVKLVPDGTRVEAIIGETSPPFTDILIHGQTTVTGVPPEKIQVKWLTEKSAELQDDTGKPLALLNVKL